MHSITDSFFKYRTKDPLIVVLMQNQHEIGAGLAKTFWEIISIDHMTRGQLRESPFESFFLSLYLCLCDSFAFSFAFFTIWNGLMERTSEHRIKLNRLRLCFCSFINDRIHLICSPMTRCMQCEVFVLSFIKMMLQMVVHLHQFASNPLSVKYSHIFWNDLSTV